MENLRAFLEYKVINIHHFHLYVYEILEVMSIFIIAFLVEKFIQKHLNQSKRFDQGTKYALHQVSYYLVIIISFFSSMNILGINISPLLMGSSVILVGIGLGLQNLFLDFISGIIILFERSIRVGDILDIDGVMGKVTHIKMRTTHLQTTDYRTIIFPNSTRAKNELIYYSSTDNLNSFAIDIGVSYDTNIELAQKLLISAAEENPNISDMPKPYVRLVDFGDSSLNLKLYFSVKNPFGINQIKSDIRMNILYKFREHNINIPYPITTIDYHPKS